MSDTGKQSPLGVNSLNSLLVAQGLQINPTFTSYAGSSTSFPSYSFGSVCQNTVLRVITYAINEAYNGHIDIDPGTPPDGTPDQTTYNNLISIGGGTTTVSITSITSGVIPDTDTIYFEVIYSSGPQLAPGTYILIEGSNISSLDPGVPAGFYNGNWEIATVNGLSFRVYITANYGNATTPGSFRIDNQVPGLGNAKSFLYTWEQKVGPYGVGSFTLGDKKGWGGSYYKNNRPLPVTSSVATANPATQWAYVRLMPLQAWMEFNYNSTLGSGSVNNPAGYRDFLQSWMNCYSYAEYSNNAILSVDNSKTFLDGTYSNMNDLITADITGVSLSTNIFGQDLIKTGKAIDLSKISTFGLPSNLLLTMVKNNALTKNVSLALLASGIEQDELGQLLGNLSIATTEQERKIYGSFNLIVGEGLAEVLIPLNCKTVGLNSLADLLNPKKLFPNSYQSLTVPVYNTTQTPTNSKTYYPIYSGGGGVNGNLNSPQVANQIGTQTPTGTPQPGVNVAQQNAVVNTFVASVRRTATNGLLPKVPNLPDENILGGVQNAGTARNTFNSSNLRQVAQDDINSVLTQATQQTLPSTVRSTATRQDTPGGGKAYDSFNNEAN
jgi:hypothetical protein